MSKSVYFKGLDGLRAIAAISVIVTHTIQVFGYTNWNFGDYAVTVFFVLSGFLITLLLVREKESVGINIKNFYLRRILRIWPLYYFYFILAILTNILFGQNENLKYSGYYIMLLPNVAFVISKGLAYLMHYWSLGVEEQFYSFWPWLIRGKRNTLKYLIVFCGLFYCIRVLTWVLNYKFGLIELYHFFYFTRFDCMAIGGIGAVLYFHGNISFLKIVSNKFVYSLSLLLFILVAFNSFHISTLIDHEIASVAALVIIVNEVTGSNNFISLDKPWLIFLGKISFGLYVYHALVIFYFLKLLEYFNFSKLVEQIIAFPGIPISTVLIAYLSYRYLEIPFLIKKGKYSTSG